MADTPSCSNIKTEHANATQDSSAIESMLVEVKKEPELLIDDGHSYHDLRDDAFHENMYDVKSEDDYEYENENEFIKSVDENEYEDEDEHDVKSEDENDYENEHEHDVKFEDEYENEHEYDVKSEDEEDKAREFLTDSEANELEELTTDSEYDTESEESDNDEDPQHKTNEHKLRKQIYSEYKNKMIEINKFIIRLCLFCELKSSTKLEWKEHQDIEHNFQKRLSNAFGKINKSTLQCKICKVSMSSKKPFYLQRHFWKHQPHPEFLQCTLCENAKFNNTLAIRDHIVNHHGTEVDKLYSNNVNKRSKNACIYCGQLCMHTMQLPGHYAERHKALDDDKIVFMCPSCGEEFAEEQMWRQHCAEVHYFNEPVNLSMQLVESSSNSSKIKFECLKCSEKLPNNISFLLFIHASSHMSYKMYKCRHCSEQFAQKFRMRLHSCAQLEAALKLKLPPINYALLANLQNERNLKNLLYVCPLCGEEFDKQDAWNQHLVAEHALDKLENMKIVAIPDKEGCTKCSICDQTFPRNVKPNKQLYHAYTHMPFKIKKCKLCKYMSGTMRKKNFCYCEGQRRLKFKLPIGPIDNSTLQCTKCAAPFEYGYELNEHLSAEHNIRLPEDLNFKLVENNSAIPIYECTKCEDQQKVKAKTYLAMFLHAIRHDELKLFKCNKCDKTTSQLHNFKKHSATCQSNQIRLYTKYIKHLCPACGQPYSSMSMLRSHIKSNHGFNTLKNLNVVEVPCFSRKKHKCTVCAYVFDAKYLSIIQEHAFSHMPFKLYICAICNAGFDKPMEIVNHVKEVHNAQADKFRAKIKCGNEDITFFCPMCDISLETETEFTDHVNEEHEFNTLEGLSMQKVAPNELITKQGYKCLDCATVVHKPIARLEHRMTHLPHKPYQCKLCKWRFGRRDYIYRHIKTCKLKISGRISNEYVTKAGTIALKENAKELNDSLAVAPWSNSTRITDEGEMVTLVDQFSEHITYACPECNIPLATKTDWETHISENHKFFAEVQMKFTPSDNLSDLRVKCKACDVLVAQSVAQKRRHLLTHLPFNSFVCALCCHRSKTAFVLINHIRRRHFGLGKFKCPMCDLVLDTPYACIQHCRSAHTPDEYPTHFCTFCMVPFPQAETLRVHMKVHDFDRETYNCSQCDHFYKHACDLKKHMRKEHDFEYVHKTRGVVVRSDASFVCAICDAKYCRKDTVKKHWHRCHPGEEFNSTSVKYIPGETTKGETKTRGRPRKLVSKSEAKVEESIIEKRKTRGRPRKLVAESNSEDEEFVMETNKKRKLIAKSHLGEDEEFVVEKRKLIAKSHLEEDEEFVVEKRKTRGRPRKIQQKCNANISMLESSAEDLIE